MNKSVIMLTICSPYNKGEVVHPVLLRCEEESILADCGFVGSLSDIEAGRAKHFVNARDMMLGVLVLVVRLQSFAMRSPKYIILTTTL